VRHSQGSWRSYDGAMALRSWDYRGPYDLRTMQDLASRLWRPGARWHVGDLAWNRFQHIGREPERRTRIWADGDTVIGWGWLSLPAELDLLVDSDRPEIVSEILDWFAASAGAAERLTAGVVDTDETVIAGLVAAGYTAGTLDVPFAYHCGHDLNGLPDGPPVLPDGYRLGHVTEATLASRVGTHRAAFHPSRVTVESYRQVRAAWPYRDDLDVTVTDADGTVVSSCLAWYDAERRAGLLEPVATRPEHERKGLAGAACVEALRRLRDAGATVAAIATRGDDAYPKPLRVYRRIGFQVISRDLTYLR
jgi:predicted N-acetyltransferase YhbS